MLKFFLTGLAAGAALVACAWVATSLGDNVVASNSLILGATMMAVVLSLTAIIIALALVNRQGP